MYDRQPTVQVAAALFQELCYANKGQLSAGLIIGGWDDQAGGEVYHIPAGGSLHKQEFSIGGSGSTYIYGYCDSNFRENMSKDEGIEFVKNGIFTFGGHKLRGVALALAMSRDGSSGGLIRMMILTGDKAPERLTFTEPNIPRFWEKE
jgi:20S proteasome subunit beta 1